MARLIMNKNFRLTLCQVAEVIEDSGDALHLLWAASPPYLKEATAGKSTSAIARAVVQLMHAFLTKAGPGAALAVVASGAVAPAVHVSVHVKDICGTYIRERTCNCVGINAVFVGGDALPLQVKVMLKMTGAELRASFLTGWQACSRMLPAEYDNSDFAPEDGVAALHVAALLMDAHPDAARHMVGMGAIALFLSR